EVGQLVRTGVDDAVGRGTADAVTDDEVAAAHRQGRTQLATDLVQPQGAVVHQRVADVEVGRAAGERQGSRPRLDQGNVRLAADARVHRQGGVRQGFEGRRTLQADAARPGRLAAHHAYRGRQNAGDADLEGFVLYGKGPFDFQDRAVQELRAVAD